MNIPIKNFGEVLISRPAGREAFLMAKAYVFGTLEESEPICLDFSGVKVLTPSWLDEFVTGVKGAYPNKIKVVNTTNETVTKTLEFVDIA